MTTQDLTLDVMVLGLIIGLVYHVLDDLKWRNGPRKRKRRK